MIKNILKLIRIKHWIKNILIFLPSFFGGKINDLNDVKLLIFIFVYFSITASTVYIINDLLDVENDRLHPEKKFRVIASGAISKMNAYLVLSIFMIILILTSFLLPFEVVALSATYLLVNILYSVYLKTIPILELFILALGFVFRILIGGIGVSIVLSKWIIMLTFFAALYVVIAKRRSEILNLKAVGTRKVLKYYTESYLTSAMIVVLGISIMTYIMYTIEDSIIKQFGTDKIYITSIFVVFGLLRHLQQALVYNKAESPVEFVFKDKFVFAIILMWFATFYLLIYI
ncbi:MAG: UbiA prenyltransferase family protein [Flavobacteriaceae bacterium]|nr:UbiA prenyltransferase family protein [Flavobacteriaceae bacterium]